MSKEDYHNFEGHKKIEEALLYVYTEKIGKGIKRIENERKITVEEYNFYMRTKIGKTIVKTRYLLPNSEPKKFIEIIIDTYIDTKIEFVVAEIEYISEEFINEEYPEILKKYIVEDISGKGKYSNKRMAVGKRNKKIKAVKVVRTYFKIAKEANCPHCKKCLMGTIQAITKKKNWIKHCPYCGKKVSSESIYYKK